MMKKTLIILSLLALFFPSWSQDLSYYLPSGVEYNPEIPTPADVIGHDVGEYHITHDKLVFYMRTLAKASDRIIIEEIGKTHEDRALIQLIVTSPENHQNLKKIKSDHLALTDPSISSSLNIEDMPAVVMQGYTIHGNEPSGSKCVHACSVSLCCCYR